MSFFLKQTKIRNRTFLQISETTYDKASKKSSNRCYKKLGFLDELITDEMNDPISFYKEEIKKLNLERNNLKEQGKKLKISEKKELRIGYFFAKAILNYLKIEEEFNAFCKYNNLDNKYYEIFETIIFSKIMSIFSSKNSVKNSFDFLYDEKKFNDDEIGSALEFVGKYYQEFSQILGKQIKLLFKTNYQNVFFDSFKSFFTINNEEICFNQSILMDYDVVPVGLIINSNIPFNSNLIGKDLHEFKSKYNPRRIIRVADRGINYGNNLYNAIIHNNGYIFPLSVISLINKDREWIADESDYTHYFDDFGNLTYKVKENTMEYFVKIVKNDGSHVLMKTKQRRIAAFNKSLEEKKKDEIYKLINQAKTLYYSNAQKYDYSKSLKYVSFIKREDKPDEVKINQSRIDNELKYAGYKMIVTSEENIPKEKLFKICEIVWKIEDYFRFLKDNMNDNKEFTKNPDMIKGNLLVGYYVATIFRLIDIKIMDSKFTATEIINFIKGMKLYQVGDFYINLLTPSQIVDYLENKYKIQISNVYYKKAQVNNLKNMNLHFNRNWCHIS